VGFGEWTQRLGLFLTPMDTDPPLEVWELEANLARRPPYSPFSLDRDRGFVRAAVIPRVFALHLALAFNRRGPSPARAARLDALVDKALKGGPSVLSNKEKIALLHDRDSLARLHREIWTLPGDQAALWGL
jgi:membrane glycosyltransferase